MFRSLLVGRTAPKGLEPNLPGDQYGRLTLIEEITRRGKFRIWSVQCGCEAKSLLDVRQDHLRSGNTTSCGCAARDVARFVGRNTATHGLSSNPLYYVWSAMIKRCTNPKSSRFSDYGGRGIHVCERWLAVENFIADMGNGYAKGLSIDRIDNDKGYSPENCRWVTPKENMRNRRSNRLVSYHGRNITLAEAADIAGLKYGTLRMRLDASKWPISRALGPGFGPAV